MSEVASDLIANIESYQQLLTTLSLGISAGSFALLVQILFHNAEHAVPVAVRAPWLMLVGVFCHLLSIWKGIETKQGLVASVPKLHQIEWGSDSATSYFNAAGLGHVLSYAAWQTNLFVAGTAILFLVLLVNVDKLTRRPTPTGARP